MALFRRKIREEHTDNQTPQQEETAQPDRASELKLHFPDHWEMAAKERYIYQYHAKKLPKIKEGQLSIHGIKFLEVNGEIVVEALIQNTVPQSLTIQAVDLVLLDEKNQPAAKKRFALDHLGELPPYTVTPFRFLFLAEDRLVNTPVSEQWKIQFQIAANHEVLDLDQGWEEKLPEDKKAHLQKILEGLPKLGSNEVNICGAELKFLDDQSLQVIVLIRNGTAKNLQLEQLPLVVRDAVGDIVCQGQFALPPLQVKPGSAKPWAFIFPQALIAKKEPDLSKWIISVNENNTQDK